MKSKLILMALAIFAGFVFTGCQKYDPNEPGNLVPKTVDEDPGLPSILVNGTQLHAETFGNPDSAMVIFLHGGPGVDYRNGLNAKQLADAGYYVIFYDQRGTGLSKREPRNSFSIQVMLDDLSAVIEHYRTSHSQKVFLLGHSWGAMLAAAYINKYPNRISGVVFAEAGGFTYDALKKYEEKTRRLELLKEATNDALYNEQFLTGKENEHAILDYRMALNSSFIFSKGNIEGIEGAFPFWRYGSEASTALFDIAEKDGFDFTTNLSQYSTKVLFLYSEHNKAHGLSTAEGEAKYFANHQITEITGTGHEMFWFKWNSVYPVVLNYFNSLK
ncbi:MAG: alpha/beta hydrolase [Ferruginibacter sp.]